MECSLPRRYRRAVRVCISILALAATASAAAEPRVELTTRAWYADNGQDESLLWGPELSGPLTGPWILRARYLQGTFNAGGDTEQQQELRFTAGWRWRAIEFGGGYARMDFDTELQPGWTWSYPAEESERNADIYGPLLYARTEGTLGRLPLGWQLQGAWLAKDFGGFDELGYDGAHIDLEAALTYERGRVRAGAGYRYVRFNDLPPRVVNDERLGRDTLDGAFAFLSFLL